MDLVELRILAAGGILALGVILSVLAVAGAAVAGRIERLRHGRRTGVVAVGSAGRARC
jgi:hypothetical protein